MEARDLYKELLEAVLHRCQGFRIMFSHKAEDIVITKCGVMIAVK